MLACGTDSSGIPREWAATEQRSGVDLLPDLSDRTAAEVADRANAVKQACDLTVVSLHWGSNWGYQISPDQRRFAHRLIDAGIDVVHGHSSRHPRLIELYHGKLVLYGRGDCVDDYEGVNGYATTAANCA